MEDLDLIGTQLVTEYLQTILLTGRVARESPVSTFLIAQPEHGKTSICLESPFACAFDVTDCTGKGIQEILKYKAEISHIILNDLTIVTAHGKAVRSYLIAVINAMTEEGIRSIAWPGKIEHYQDGKRGIIACCTPSLVKDSRVWFNKIGLTSRIVPFQYQYSESLIIKIKAAISQDAKQAPPKTLPMPEKCLSVHISDRMAIEIQKIAESKSKELEDPTGIRRLKQFRRMAQAHALMDSDWKKPEVQTRDLEFLMRIFPYIDYKNACILL